MAFAKKWPGDTQCNEILESKSGKCDVNQCQAGCVKKHKVAKASDPQRTSNGTGIISAALSGNEKPKPLALAPPPNDAIKTRSHVPSPPNDPVISRIASDSSKVPITQDTRMILSLIYLSSR
ncbi:unnamed protein product [Eruca vesicaria subsp. sativa]|uniref:Uncharacterized protein n=1 Tax=Eruca vesicaria subsp. sativa TaxID=29727 RepID=A0ABC8LKV2_ERUVS|nr:unnamed protein product [Eruca vesicaria subsp. sativa]